MPTVQIPGGTAVLRDASQLKVKHRRPIQVLVGSLGPARAEQMQRVIAEDGVRGLDRLGLSPREYELIFLMNEATLYAVLESWTIEDPFPQSAEDIGDMRGDLYDALMVEAAKVAVPDDRFSLTAVEDLESPTGASVASSGRSAGARKAPSDRKKPSGSRSTATAVRSRA